MLYYCNTKSIYKQAIPPKKKRKSLINKKNFAQNTVEREKKEGFFVKDFAKKGLGGLSVGIANSVFGGGGGMLAVPILRKFGLEERKAHATAILVILPVSFLSFLVYFYKRLYDLSVLVPTALGVTAGGALGAVLLNKLPSKAVGIVFAQLQLFAGGWMLFAR